MVQAQAILPLPFDLDSLSRAPTDCGRSARAVLSRCYDLPVIRHDGLGDLTFVRSPERPTVSHPGCGAREHERGQAGP